MNKQKAGIVTGVCGGMLVLILAGLWLLLPVVFYALAGLLALYGLIKIGAECYFWLLEDAPEADFEEAEDDGLASYDEVKAVLGSEMTIDREAYDAILAEMREGADEPAL